MTTAKPRKTPGVRRLPSGRYRAEIMVGRTRRSEVFDSEAQASAWRADLAVKRESGSAVPAPRPSMTVGDVYEILVGSRRDTTTASKDRNHWNAYLRPTFARRRLNRVGPAAVEEWLSDMRAAKRAEGTIDTAFGVLRAIFGLAIRRGWLDGVNPCSRIAKEHRPAPGVTEFRVIADDEFDRMLAAAPTERDAAVLVVMRDTGARISEVCALRVRDVREARIVYAARVDHDTNEIKDGLKNRSTTRQAPLTARVRDALAPLVEGKAPADLVFAGARGATLNARNWTRRVWHPLVEAAGLPGVQPTPHDMRHSFLTFAAEGGMPTHRLLELAGHKDPRSILRYVHVADDFLDDYAQTLDARAAKTKRGHLRAI